MALTTRLNVQLDATQTSALDLVSATAPLSLPYRKQLTNGILANQANLVWSDQRTIAASGNDDIDLGALTDPFGGAVVFARIKTMIVRAAATNVNNVVVGGASNTFGTWVTGTSPAVLVRPDGLLLLSVADATAYVVTADTGDTLRVSNSSSGSSVVYDIVLIGTSAA
jgi:hypothetical protein